MNVIKRKLRHAKEDFVDVLNGGRWLPIVVAVILIYLLVCIIFGLYWSVKPKSFDVIEVTVAKQPKDQAVLVTGAVTTATTLKIVETLLHKNGGYISNDVFPPGVWLDNMPSWEYGVVLQVRDMSKALREAFARSQSQSGEDTHLAKADPRFNFSTQGWILPSTESTYEEGYEALEKYFLSLVDSENDNPQFYARADNVNYWLDMVSKRLGSMSQRLSASVAQEPIHVDVVNDNPTSSAKKANRNMLVKTPWSDIDNVFFEARGTTWALLHLLKAVEVDFQLVLDDKNATLSLQQIIQELEMSQKPYYSPMVLNGGGFGLLANHSLVMASYISRANAGVIELRSLLTQG